MKLVLAGLIGLFLFGACAQSKETSNAENSGVMIKKDWHEEGFTWVQVTKEYSEGDCGYLLKNKDNEELELFIPVEWKGGREVDGEEFWIKYTPSRIRQETCLNAQPIVITEFRL